MSREQWRSKSSASGQTSGNWREAFVHRPLKGRTTDPEALEFDEASELFLRGLKLARRGDLKAGRSQIASAFLMDERSINFCVELPDPSAADMAIDSMLFYELIEGDSYGAMVLLIALAQYLGHTSEGQTFLAGALRSIDNLVKLIEREPKLEAPREEGGVLGGFMTRKKLLYLGSVQYIALGNHQKAIKDLTYALEIDPAFTRARDSRASLWAGLSLKDDAIVHAEYKRIINEVHEDNRRNEVAYAWLACLTLGDARLGTVQDAKGYYEKMVRAKARRDELYGYRAPYLEPPILEITTTKFAAYAAAPPETRKFREDLDVAFLSGNMQDLQIPGAMQAIPRPKEDKTRLHRCLKCRKSARDIGGPLSKCGRCKEVSYCSRKCQKADWKNHQIFCDVAIMPKPSLHAVSKAEKERVKAMAKTPIDENNGLSRAATRMEKQLRKLYEEYGKGFADWWHKKSSRKREKLLLDLTDKTLPPKMLELSQVRADLMQGISSRVCLEYNVETLVGQCGCARGEECIQMGHYYPDRLLHEVYMRAMEPERADSADRCTCIRMRKRDIFPDLFPGIFVVFEPNKGDGPEKDDLKISILNDECPEPEKEKMKEMIEDGLFLDGSVAVHALNKKVYSLYLLIKLFEFYQQMIRGVFPLHPYGRLKGCEYCHQTCEEDGAVRCRTCEVIWWCCQGCQEASEHGQKCPVGQPVESKVLFT